MDGNHPITPPDGLVGEWWAEETYDPFGVAISKLATQAARWGADQQLELDAKWLDHNALNEAHLKVVPMGEVLKEAMRPKPPSLKQQALEALEALPKFAIQENTDFICVIRRALESLPD